VTAEYVMGNDGLAGADLPKPTMQAAPGHAVDFIIATLRNSPEPVTIATLGPQTNLALALIKAPDIRDNVARLVVMGGTMARGNIVPQAEYNIYVDPHAAQVVLNAGLDMVVIGLDVTHQVLNTVDRIRAIGDIGTRSAIAVNKMFMPHAEVQETLTYDDKPRGLMHDSCVTAYLLNPSLFSGKAVNMQIETSSETTMGATVVDWWQVTKRNPNVTMMNTVDVEGFFELVFDRLGRLA